MLSIDNLQKITRQVRDNYDLSEHAEISIECNPDDLNSSQLQALRQLGFNRISMGIQSFREEDLKLMKRSHSARQALCAVEDASSAGFDNITIDLIYGIPSQTPAMWRENILRALELQVNHISAYHLTFEAGTVFDHWRKKGRIAPVAEDESVKMYLLLREELGRAGFEHYEISNFAKKGWRSRHNQLYWSGESYLGFGPSAHSFDGNKRFWNVASLKKYMSSLEEGEKFWEAEELSTKERYHDFLITSLRCSEGADPQIVEDRFGIEVKEFFLEKAARFVDEGQMIKQNNNFAIHPDSWLLGDHIMRELFLA